MPLPNTRIIPKHWSAHHAPALGSSTNATCFFYDPEKSQTDWDPETGEVGETTYHFIQGTVESPLRCRVVAQQKANPTEQADQLSTERPYLVQVFDSSLGDFSVEERHEVRIVSADNDPRLVGRSMRVESVQMGSERFMRDVWCLYNEQAVVT